MKNILVVGDIHGRAEKLNFNMQDYDKIVFIGDYWDSFDIDYQTQKSVFLKIIELKKQYPDKIVLLIGNHDYHYINLDLIYRCSGFQDEHYIAIHQMLNDNIDMFSAVHIEGKYVFSHAGISQNFLNQIDFKYGLNVNELSKLPINQLPQEFFWIGPNNQGKFLFDGPLWLRPNVLIYDTPALNQIFGHTYYDNIQRWSIGDNMLICVDCPENLKIKI